MPELPNPIIRAKNFSIAAIQHFLSKSPTCSQQEINRRLLICQNCTDYYMPEHALCSHKACGCNLGDQIRYLNKLAWADQKCPIDRWGAPMERKVTICITTFLREECLRRLQHSIKQFYPDLQVEVIDTQGNLSWGRNRLFESATTPYILMCDDDYVFTDQTKIEVLVDILDSDPEIGVVGGVVEESAWCHDFEVFRGELKCHLPRIPMRQSKAGFHYQPCNLIHNFGLFRKQLYFDGSLWDEDLEIQEHTEFFYRLWREGKWRAAATNAVRIGHERKTSPEYKEMRKRDFSRILNEKMGGLKLSPPVEKYKWPIVTHVRDTNQQRLIKQAVIDFNKYFQDVFPICGTLLGMVRDNSIIPWDTDGDFGTFKPLDPKRTVGPFRLKKKLEYNNQLVELAYRHDNGIKIDLFRLFQQEDKICWRGVFDGQDVIRCFDPTLLNALVQREVWGNTFTMFKNSEEWLRQNYGDSWRTPNASFSYV